MKKKSGLTLIEVSLTVVLASVVALAVYSTLSFGVRIWQRFQAGMAEEDAALFFSKAGDEFENTLIYAGLKFHGNQTSLTFPTIISSRFHYAHTGQGPVLVSYVFDDSDGVIKKAYYSLVDIYNGDDPALLPVLDGIESLGFSYYFFDNETEEYLWSGDWPPSEGVPRYSAFPLAVRLALSFQKGDKTYEYNQTVSLPLAAR